MIITHVWKQGHRRTNHPVTPRMICMALTWFLAQHTISKMFNRWHLYVYNVSGWSCRCSCWVKLRLPLWPFSFQVGVCINWSLMAPRISVRIAGKEFFVKREWIQDDDLDSPSHGEWYHRVLLVGRWRVLKRDLKQILVRGLVCVVSSLLVGRFLR